MAALGAAATPYLVEALSDPSAELRQRALLLLAQHNPFEDLVPHLLPAIDRPGDRFVRTLLREHTLRQVEAAKELPNAERMFQFWGTNLDTYRDQALVALQEAKTSAEVARVVEPLLDLHRKTVRFSELVSRLAELSVGCEHPQSPGCLIAETLARGLHENRSEHVAFAAGYVESLETLARGLKEQNFSRQAIRQEVASRAEWSRGAASYLVQLFDPASLPSSVLSQYIGISPQALQESFFLGLSSTDTKTYTQGVGRIHIVDLLGESIHGWPNAPPDGVRTRLITSTIECAKAGDKPKALLYLDTLDACRLLSTRGMDIQQGLGSRLAERLFIAASAAENHRGYYPARRVHDHLTTLIHRGISTDHDAYPRELLENYLRGSLDATSQRQRLALERYLDILDRVTALGIRWDQSTAQRFAHALRKQLITDSGEFAQLIEQLDRLAREPAFQDGARDSMALDRSLAGWTEQMERGHR